MISGSIETKIEQNGNTMKIRVKRSCIEETLLLVLFGFYVLVAHWIWFGRGIQETIMICLSILVILKSIKLKKISVNILPNSILWGTLFLICGFGFVRAKTHQYLVSRFKGNVWNNYYFILRL